MEKRYIRNVPALSETELSALRSKEVAVIGCGGLGGYLVEYLARMGIGAIRVVDGDVFDESNLNRQLLCSSASLGKNKAWIAAERIRQIDPSLSVQAHPVFLGQSNARQLIAGCHAVLDGLDNIPARRLLAKACEEENIPYIYGAIDRWTAQAAIVLPADRLLEKLYPQDAASGAASVLSFTPAVCAGMQAALCAKLLTGRSVETGKLHYLDLLQEEYEQLSIK